MSRGRYIVLDGDECAGKTTQLERLVAHLTERGIDARIIREPGGDPVAEQLREIVKYSHYDITALAELFMFLAARANLLENVVAPLLKANIWIVSDRSYASSNVYQGVARGLFDDARIGDFCGQQQVEPRLFVSQVIMLANMAAHPDLYVILDIPLAVSQARMLKRGIAADRFESESGSFRRTINDGFRRLSNQPPFQAVDGHQPEQAVHNEIWALVEPLIRQERD